MDDAHTDFLVGHFLQRSLHSLSGALDVSLDDNVQVLHLTGLDLAEQILQGDLTHGTAGRILQIVLALLHQFAGHALVSNGVEVVTGTGNLAHTDDLNRNGRTGLHQLLTAGAGHGTDTANGSAGNDHVTLLQGTVLHQQSGHRATALVQTGLDDGTVGSAVGVGLQLAHLGGQGHHVQQVVDTHAGLGRDGADNGLAAPLLRHQLILGQLLHDTVGVSGGLIHLIDGNNDGNLSGLSVVDGLDGLGHDAVVGSHHQNGNVGDHGTAGTHGCKGLVTRGIQEGNGVSTHLDLICTDMLGDAASLAGGYVGAADIVQQRGLAVVNVTHDNNNGSAGLQILSLILADVDQLLLNGDDHFLLHLAAHLFRDDGGGVKVDDLAQGSHDAVLHQALDNLGAGLLHAGGQLANADLVRNKHLNRGLLGDLQLQAAHTLLLFLLALVAEAASLLAAALTLGIAALELLLAAASLLTLGGKVLQSLVVLIQIHIAGTAGVHNLLLRHTADRLLDVVLLGRSGLLLVVLNGLLCRSSLLFSLGSGSGLGLVIGIGKDRLDGVDLVLLGHIIKDDGQLTILQNLHVVLGGLAVLGQDLSDLLGVQLQILGHLMDTIFIHHRKATSFR